jgi:hypothetical protein
MLATTNNHCDSRPSRDHREKEANMNQPQLFHQKADPRPTYKPSMTKHLVCPSAD